jgi:hypothetical protein
MEQVANIDLLNAFINETYQKWLLQTKFKFIQEIANNYPYNNTSNQTIYRYESNFIFFHEKKYFLNSHRSGWNDTMYTMINAMKNKSELNEILLIDNMETFFLSPHRERKNYRMPLESGQIINIDSNLIKFDPERLSSNEYLFKYNDEIYLENPTKGPAVKVTQESYPYITEEYYQNLFPLSFDKIPRPFVMIIHSTPETPIWFSNKCSLIKFAKLPYFANSLDNCLGIYTLSDYLKQYMINSLEGNPFGNIPINVLMHPTETNVPKFSFDAFLNNENKSIIQIGFWIRHCSFIQKIKTSSYKKIWLPGNLSAIDVLQREYMLLNDTTDGTQAQEQWSNILIARVTNEIYDILFTNNIIVIDLIDASCNNAVIECMARNTPILINKHPAVVEYLGEDYPFYFNPDDENLYEKIQLMLEDYDLIKRTHQYMVEKELWKLVTFEHFLKSLGESDIFQKYYPQTVEKCELSNDVTSNDTTTNNSTTNILKTTDSAQKISQQTSNKKHNKKKNKRKH